MSAGGSVLQRRTGTEVIRDVIRDAVGQRRILIEERFYPLQIANARGRANVHSGTARTQVAEHLSGRDRPVIRHIAPAAEMIISIREMDGAGAVLPPGVEVGSPRQKQIEDVELARGADLNARSEEHTSELQSRRD